LSTPFKNRLVGTIIVAAVVVIFLPNILDGEKKTYQDDFEAIPQAPEFSGKQTSKTFPNDKVIYKPTTKLSNELALDNEIDTITEDISTAIHNNSEGINRSNSTAKATVTAAQTAIKPASNKTKTKVAQGPLTKVEPKTLPKKATLKESWVIHLGSFKHKSNVEQLLKKLKTNGYIAFTKPIKTKQGMLTKVFIGPELIKSSLDKKVIGLKALTGTQGKVARYYPNK